MKKLRPTRGFDQLRLLLAAIPLLAGVYAAAVASSNSWPFFNEMDRRLPFALILAFIVYVLVSAVGLVLFRLHRVSDAAQAGRNQIELRKRIEPNKKRR